MTRKTKNKKAAHPGKTQSSPGVARQGHQEPNDGQDCFPVVAIGASAGGLAAIKNLFAHVPKESGVAFVIVVHLSPEHESHMVELLQPHAPFPVQQVTQSVRLERDHVYVIPPNANLDAIDTHLRLSELEARRQQRAPIDHFLRTLAESHGRHAIGVILTGTGSDGTLGLRQIKEHGGLTVVQDPAEAEYDGMPQSALTGAPVDLVLPLSEIPGVVLRFAHTAPALEMPRDGEDATSETRQFLQMVFAQIRARTGRDFTHYKRSTILRRISRRMQFNHIEEPSAYLDLLRKLPQEAQALADDLLITVTSFFRDPEVFEALVDKVIPKLFEENRANDSIRVWSVGCATGEEAYSLAILLAEEAARRPNPPAIQVFATDLHDASLTQGREGLYPGDIEADVSPERLQQFFLRENGGYRVRRDIRELVLFAQHNVLSDPPFSKIDLVSCRNLLIYLNRDLHQQLAELFHYALNPGGFIVLGTSESMSTAELFQLEDKKQCLYRRRNVPAPEVRLPVFPLVRGTTGRKTHSLPQEVEPVQYSTLHQRIVTRYGPPSLLVSPDDNVVHVSERAGRYLVQPEGPITSNVFKLVRQELRVELHAAMADARRGKKEVQSKRVPVRFNGEKVPVALHVQPALEQDQEGFVVVAFDERIEQGRSGQEATEHLEPAADGKDLSKIERLEAEKRTAERRLQQLIDEHETSQEELKASNEELQSANEELRSTLEELETSKEELQSINEELHALNQENRHKVEEMGQLSSDLQNLFAATDIATLFLDRDFRILRFTPKTAKLFNVQASDRGRPISHLTHRLGHDSLLADAGQVLERLVPIEREVEDQEGRWHMMRVLPYRDVEDRIAGVVITFVDITERKRAEVERERLVEELGEAKDYAEKIIESHPEPLLVLTADLLVKSANEAFFDHFSVAANETLGRKIYTLGNGQWDIPSLKQLLEEILPQKKTFDGYEVDHVFEDIGRRVMLLNGRQLDHLQLILLGIADITDRKRAEDDLRESHRHKDAFLAMLGHELRNPLGVIRSVSDLLQRSDVENASIRRATGVLARQSVHMARIIDGLLDLSRIARGKIHLEIDTIDVREVLEDVLVNRAPQASRRGIELRTDIGPEPLWVRGDSTRLAQVVDNLLGNAIKFTEASGSITVELAKNDNTALIRVRDTGCGVRPELLTKIFEAFEQESQDVARTAGGLGMGLALSKGLVELHHGTITAHSAGPGQGAEFEVCLPLASPPETPRIQETKPRLQSRRVLLVEDNTDAAQMLRDLLELSGHEVQVAGTAREGLTLLHDGGADVVLCDLGLPDMDGYAFARAVRGDEKHAKLPLVAVSGYGQPEDRKRTAEAGFDDHLVKPVDIEAVNRVLAGLGHA